MTRGVYVKEDAIRSADSWLIRRGGIGLIRINASIPQKGRKRFAVGHELGHWELHDDLSQVFFCTEAELAGYTKSAPEIEANIFSAELLMPTALFQSLCREGDPDLRLVIALAKSFQTTITASAIRYVDEITHTCVLVFSDSGKICWWKKKESWKEIWLELPESIPEHSNARECLQAVDLTISKVENIDPQMWLHSFPENKEIELHEQSIKLGSRPWVITLLWIVSEDLNEGTEDMWTHFNR
jgi:Zn-dependent peptidase ImmA (M78 family)